METVSWRAWGAGLQEGGARGRTARARPHVRHPHAECPGRPGPALLGRSLSWPRDNKSPPPPARGQLRTLATLQALTHSRAPETSPGGAAHGPRCTPARRP